MLFTGNALITRQSGLPAVSASDSERLEIHQVLCALFGSGLHVVDKIDECFY